MYFQWNPFPLRKGLAEVEKPVLCVVALFFGGLCKGSQKERRHERGPTKRLERTPTVFSGRMSGSGWGPPRAWVNWWVPLAQCHDCYRGPPLSFWEPQFGLHVPSRFGWA